MNIAILTLPIGKNYGGIMQAWALQQVLKKLGHTPITLNRKQDKRSIYFNVTQHIYRRTMILIGRRKAPVDIEKYLPTILANNIRFITSHIDMSEEIRSSRGLRDYMQQHIFDAVIVGSDQTWRPGYVSNIYNYYLDFLEGHKVKRVAYASSFGVNNWEYNNEQTKRCSDLARLFNAVSVREVSGIKLCNEFLGIGAEHVLDPTLLLSKNDYERLVLECGGHIDKAPSGMFTYFLDGSSEKQEIAKRICIERSLKLTSCQPKRYLGDGGSSDIEDYVMPSVIDWLAGIANSDCVLTDSFHGMVFAIIFGKKFGVIVNDKRGAARFSSLAEIFNLPPEVFMTPGQPSFSLSDNPGLLDSKKFGEIFRTSYEFLRREL